MFLKIIIKKILHAPFLISFARRHILNDEWQTIKEELARQRKVLQQAQGDLKEKHVLLQEKDDIIRRKNSVIEDFRKTILDRNNLLKEKDDIIRRKNSVIEDFRKTILDRNNLLKGKDDIILKKNSVIEDFRKTILDRNNLLEEKDDIILKKNSVIEDFRKTILDRNNLLKENDALLLQKKQKMEELQSVIQEQKKHLQEKENSWNAVSRLASWSQAGEDRIIANALHAFCGLQSIDGLFYIDIGGNDPERDNNTRYLYRRKGNGIILEPNHELAEKFRQLRPRDIVLEAGVSFSPDLKRATYYNFGSRFNGYNTFSKERAEYLLNQKHLPFQMEEKELISLPTLWDTYCTGKDVHLFSLDVEGFEMDILKTFCLHKNRPWILCIESDQDDFSPYAKHPLIDFLSERDYILAANSGINYIFIAQEHFSLQSFIWS